MGEREIANSLLKIGAVSLNTAVPFKYASGMLSPIYVDCRMISSFPRERKKILNEFIEYIDNSIGRQEFDLVVGSGHSGISLTAYIAQRLGLPMAYVRSAKKEHGKENLIEGLVNEGDRVLLVSDIMATETHIPTSINALTEKKATVSHVLTIFTLNLGIVEGFLEKNSIKFHALSNLKALLDEAVEEKGISEIEKKEIEKWMKEPEKWDERRKGEFATERQKSKEKIAEILLKIKAVTLSPEKPYRFVSGILSPIYCDNRLLMSNPKEWRFVIDSMLSIIANKIGLPNIDVIAGTATAGISHAAYVSEKANLPMIYIKSEAEQHGKYVQIEGSLKPNQKVLVIEDLISTGGSSINAVETVRKTGGIVNECLAIFTYGMQKSIDAFSQAKVELISLTDFNTLIDVAAKNNYIKEAEKNKVLEWAKDSAGWGKKMGFES